MSKTENKLNHIRSLTLAEAAGVLQISIRTLQRMIRSKKLPAFKIGGQWRIRASQLQRWIEHRESLESGKTGKNKT